MANWGVVLAGPLEAGGQVERLVHIVPRDQLVQPVYQIISKCLKLLKFTNFKRIHTHFESLWNLASSGPASA